MVYPFHALARFPPWQRPAAQSASPILSRRPMDACPATGEASDAATRQDCAIHPGPKPCRENLAEEGQVPSGKNPTTITIRIFSTQRAQRSAETPGERVVRRNLDLWNY